MRFPSGVAAHMAANIVDSFVLIHPLAIVSRIGACFLLRWTPVGRVKRSGRIGCLMHFTGVGPAPAAIDDENQTKPELP